MFFLESLLDGVDERVVEWEHVVVYRVAHVGEPFAEPLRHLLLEHLAYLAVMGVDCRDEVFGCALELLVVPEPVMVELAFLLVYPCGKEVVGVQHYEDGADDCVLGLSVLHVVQDGGPGYFGYSWGVYLVSEVGEACHIHCIVWFLISSSVAEISMCPGLSLM